MEMWNTEVAYRAAERAGNDEFYRELLRECEEKAEVYKKIVAQLSDEQQELIEDYIAACEELEHRMAQLAYAMGRYDEAKS